MNKNIWVAWNVGQGLWVTNITPLTCTHFDFGGEIGSFKNIRDALLSHCAYKENRLNLSHWHADHYMNFSYLLKAIPNLCWESQPLFKPINKSTEKIRMVELPTCESATRQQFQSWTPLNFKTANESSRIFLFQKVLLPGDSPKSQEKIWSRKINHINETKVLILGHHGSHSSTGPDLLRQLTQLKFSISSARNSRYGHPHRTTVKHLKQRLVPILRTEDWGHIWFYP